MARTGTMTYNPQTGTWTHSSTSGGSKSKTSSGSSGGSSSNKKNTSSSGGSGGSSSGDNLTSSGGNKNSSTGQVEKKYNYIEMNTLEGTLSFIVSEGTIKLKAGDTVKLIGIGKYLSGNYYVKDITRNISSNGYSHTATLIKTDFGDSLKLKSKTTKGKKKKTTKKKVKSTPSKKTATRTYTVKSGDCLWNIAKKYYGNGALWNKIYDANTGKIANPNLIYPGQVFVIP